MDNNEYFASINEVSKRLSVPAYTLRYWEKQFPVAIRPTTGAGGRRYYRAETVNRLIVIKDLLYKHGMTIAGVKKMLRDGNLPATVDEIGRGAIATAGGDAPRARDDNATNAARGAESDINRDAINLAIGLLTGARDLLV